jgi:DNA-binding response OmpR family regulator
MVEEMQGGHMLAAPAQPFDEQLPGRDRESFESRRIVRDHAPARDILLVEDEQQLRESMATRLEEEGYSVAHAPGGAQVLHLLQHGRHRLLLLDLRLPGMDAMDVLGSLRADPALRPPAVLILADPRDRDQVLAALEAGADDYLTKPFDLQDLALRVSLWLHRVSAATRLAPPGLRVWSLGRFYVEHGGQVRLHADTRPQKARALFTYLLSREGRPVARAEAFTLLWPGAEPDLQATSLRTLLYQLRRQLGLAAQGTRFLEVGAQRLALRLGPGDWWDVAEFRAWLAEGERWLLAGDADRALDAYAAGLALYGGDYLEEEQDALWARQLRGQLRMEWLDALCVLARLYGGRAAWVEQEAALRRVLLADAYREPERRALMELLAANGRRAEALLLYRELETLLRTELAATPAAETRALVARITAQDAS